MKEKDSNFEYEQNVFLTLYNWIFLHGAYFAPLILYLKWKINVPGIVKLVWYVHTD